VMEMAVRSMETAETTMETDGDGSGGTSLSRQGAGTEISVPQNSSVAAAELRNSFWKFADYLRVFRREALFRRRGGIRGPPGGPHHPLARPGGGTPPPGEPALWPSSGSLSVLVLRPGKIGVSAFILSNSENISCVDFLKHKNSRK
jgi:hypothetical protein